MYGKVRLRSSVRCALAIGAPHRRSVRLLRLGVLAALLWGFANAPALAQAPYQQEVIPGFSSLEVGYHSSPDWVDLDGDGDLDLVAGDDYGRLHFFENIGTSAEPSFVERTRDANPFTSISGGFFSSPELVDLDADGDMDLIGGELYGTFRFFENTGSSSAPAFLAVTGSANPLNGFDVGDRNRPALGDLDGDGDFDAVAGAQLGTLSYFANTGSSVAPAFVARTGTASPFNGIDVGSRSAPALADVDGDGDLDAVVGEYYGAMRYFENTGAATAPAFIQRIGSANPFALAGIGLSSNPELGDLDGDGDLDAVVGQRFGGMIYLRNSGSSSSPAYVAPTGILNPLVGITVGAFSSPVIVDLDGDGNVDVVVGSNEGTLRTFANTGSMLAPSFVELTSSANPFAGFDVGSDSNPALGDLDGDGDLDAVVGAFDGTLRSFENTGSTSAPAFVELSAGTNPLMGIDIGTWSSPDLADLDGDGDFDVVTGGMDGTLRLFSNTGSPTSPAFIELSGTANPFNEIDIGSQSTPVLADLDRDADLDLLVGANAGNLRFYQNTGSVSAAAFVHVTGTMNPFGGIDMGARSRPALGDLDGDGDLDALVGQESGTLVFFRSLFAGALLFSDGFETGDTSAWSQVPPP